MSEKTDRELFRVVRESDNPERALHELSARDRERFWAEWIRREVSR